MNLVESKLADVCQLDFSVETRMGLADNIRTCGLRKTLDIINGSEVSEFTKSMYRVMARRLFVEMNPGVRCG